MPVNATSEYYKAEEKFLKAKTLDEKISALEEMIRALPKHKGSENLLALLRKRLAKLKKERELKRRKKGKYSGPIVKKEGAAQICIIGISNSGKSTLLYWLTGKEVEISEKPFTTQKPEIGMMNFKGVKLQVVELPSTFEGYINSILNNCDVVLALIDATQDKEYQINFLKKLLEERGWLKKTIFVATKGKLENYFSVVEREDAEKLKEIIWKKLNLIRIFTKSPGKKPSKEALSFKGEVRVKDVCERLGDFFVEKFKYAKVYDRDLKRSKKVGINYRLKDGDIVEIHTSV